MSNKRLWQQAFGLTLIVLLLTGCGEALAEPTATTTPVPPTATPTSVPLTATPTHTQISPTATPTSHPPTEIPESTVSNEFFDSRIGISVTKVETSRDLPTDYDLPNANEGYTYVSVHLTVTQIEGVHLVNIFGFGEEKPQLNDGEGQSYALIYGTVQGVRFKDPQNITSSTELIEGAEGVLVFEIPEDREPAGLDLIYSYQDNWDEDSPKKRGEMAVTLE